MNTQKKYSIRIYWSDEDEAFIAEVPALKGCISHGDTMAEAVHNIQEAMELWLNTAEKIGKPIPDPDFARARIEEIGSLLNLTELARRTGIKRATLASKLRRKTPFTSEEGQAIKKVLETA